MPLRGDLWRCAKGEGDGWMGKWVVGWEKKARDIMSQLVVIKYENALDSLSQTSNNARVQSQLSLIELESIGFSV